MKLHLPRFAACAIGLLMLSTANVRADTVADSSTATPTGVLDLVLRPSTNGSYVLGNANYQLTFPGKPQVSAQDTPSDAGVIKGASALQGDVPAFGFFLVPIPPGVTYDAKAGVKGARDGMINNTKAKMVSESQTQLSGVPVNKVIATTKAGPIDITLTAWIGFDEVQRTMFGVFTLEQTGKPSTLSQAFVDSFRALAGPAKPAEIVKTGVNDIEIAPAGNSFVLRGPAFSAKFASKPAFSTFDVPWPSGSNKGVSAIAEYSDGHGAQGILATYVPAGISYDPVAGIDGARDKMFEGMKVKLTSEKTATLAGAKGRVMTGTGRLQDKPITVRATIVYLAKARVVFGVLTMWHSDDKIGKKRGDAFVKTVTISKAAK
jgi:hypothetical protein